MVGDLMVGDLMVGDLMVGDLMVQDLMVQDQEPHRVIGRQKINRAAGAHDLRWSNHEAQTAARVTRAPIVVGQQHPIRPAKRTAIEAIGLLTPIAARRRSLRTRSLIAWTKTATACCLEMSSRRSPSSTAVIVVPVRRHITAPPCEAVAHLGLAVIEALRLARITFMVVHLGHVRGTARSCMANS